MAKTPDSETEEYTPHKFLLYFQQMHAIAFPKTRRSKIALYKLRAQIMEDTRFSGRSLLIKLVDELSNNL